jgi:hypothetical protein
VDLERDTLEVRYAADRLTPAAMLQAVSKQGFEGKIIAGPSVAGAR